MLRLMVAAAFSAVTVSPAVSATDGTPIALPSGLTVTFLDVVTDAPGMGPAHRFRFVSTELDANQDYTTTEADMAHLCRAYALPRVESADPRPEAIVITLADRAVPFGEMAPEAVQFFEAYRPEGGECVWQGF